MVVKDPTDRRGFTMIEVFIVLCIIGVFSSLVISLISKRAGDGPKIEFQQPSIQSTAPYTIEATGPSPFKILAKGMVGNQEIIVFDYDGHQYLITYSGYIVRHNY